MRVLAILTGVLLLGGGYGRAGEPTPVTPPGPPLPGTRVLDPGGDMASNLVAGVDRFLMRKLEGAAAHRDRFGRRDLTSVAAYDEAALPERRRLARILGAVEARPSAGVLEFVASAVQPALVATNSAVRVEAVRWRAFGDVHGEGLLLTPVNGVPKADVVALPDVEFTPEQWVGLDGGCAGLSDLVPLRLAAAGCRVVVPFLIDRVEGQPKVDWDPARGAGLHNREFLHRAAFEMGRTVTGYEVVKVRALLDLLTAENGGGPVGLFGWGEGGRLALYTAALDPRVRATVVSGSFGPRDGMWEEPLDRNLFGMLEHFGDAEVAALVAPRALIVEPALVRERVFKGRGGGAPGRIGVVPVAAARSEVERARAMTSGLPGSLGVEWLGREGSLEAAGSDNAVRALLRALGVAADESASRELLVDLRRWVDPRSRADRQRHELDRHTQALLVDSASLRAQFMKSLDTSSLEAFGASQNEYRRYFAEEVIGRWTDALLPASPRTRLAYDHPKWRGYEVVLDVYPDVIAYGLLLLPKDLADGDRRPVVVCQHGLEGRPQHTIGAEGSQYYSAFSSELASRGYVVFAPQNLYLFGDRFRVLQRKSNPLGRTLFSIITPQHRQIVDWLKRQPFVDPERVAFYGLSYGGKTAMRVPALVTDYCLSICSADFNEWVWKNASTRSPYSYVFTGEYEIFEWNLGHTFNYAEMAALIAPRPFMVERGHFDGVAPDETVAYEFAKVRHLYAGRLKLPPEQCVIEWFVGPHTIHGQGTYEFLRRHLLKGE